MTDEQRTAIRAAIKANDWGRLRRIAGKGCILALIRRAA